MTVPGGNVTGLAGFSSELTGKRLETPARALPSRDHVGSGHPRRPARVQGNGGGRPFIAPGTPVRPVVSLARVLARVPQDLAPARPTEGRGICPLSTAWMSFQALVPTLSSACFVWTAMCGVSSRLGTSARARPPKLTSAAVVCSASATSRGGSSDPSRDRCVDECGLVHQPRTAAPHLSGALCLVPEARAGSQRWSAQAGRRVATSGCANSGVVARLRVVARTTDVRPLALHSLPCRLGPFCTRRRSPTRPRS